MMNLMSYCSLVMFMLTIHLVKTIPKYGNVQHSV